MKFQTWNFLIPMDLVSISINTWKLHFITWAFHSLTPSFKKKKKKKDIPKLSVGFFYYVHLLWWLHLFYSFHCILLHLPLVPINSLPIHQWSLFLFTLFFFSIVPGCQKSHSKTQLTTSNLVLRQHLNRNLMGAIYSSVLNSSSTPTWQFS